MLEDIRLQENDGYDLESASELVKEVYESHYVYTSASPIIHYQRNLPSSAVTETAPLLVIALRDLFWLDVQSTALLFDDFWLGDSEGIEFMERLVCPSSFFPQVYGGYGLWPSNITIEVDPAWNDICVQGDQYPILDAMVGKPADGSPRDFLFRAIDYCHKLVVDKYITNGNNETDEHPFIWLIDRGRGGAQYRRRGGRNSPSWPDCTYETGGWAKGAVFYDCEHTYMEADSYGPLIGDFLLLRTDRGLPPYTEEWYQTSDCFMQWLNWQILFTRISERDSWVNGGPEDVIFEV